MTDPRPPLPEPEPSWHYSADQMLSYADTCTAALQAERDAALARVRELEALMQSMNVCLWNPNPMYTDGLMVRPGKGKDFSEAARAARAALDKP